MSGRIRSHIHSNIVGYIALFAFAMSGSAYALNGPAPGTNSVGTADIINKEVKRQDVALNAVNSSRVAADTLTGADIQEITLGAGGDLSGTLANLQIAAGAVGTTEVDGSLTGADIFDSSLTGGDIFNGTLTDADLAAANKDGAAATPSLRTLGTGAAQAMPGNALPGGPPTGAAGGSLTGTYPTPTIASDAIGTNEVDNETLTSVDLANRTRSVSIPLASFIECQTDTGAFLDFSNGADIFPDFSNSATDGQGFSIRFDDTTGSKDEGTEICSQLKAPQDYSSGGTFEVRVTKDGNGGATEQIGCAVSEDGGALSSQATNNINTGTLEQGECSPTLVTSPNTALSFYLTVTSPTSIDDQVDIRAVDFTYTATS